MRPRRSVKRESEKRSVAHRRRGRRSRAGVATASCRCAREQAEPADTTPRAPRARAAAARRAAPGKPARGCAARATAGRVGRAPRTRRRAPSIRCRQPLARRAIIRAAAWAARASASSAARPSATIAGTFSVPGRSPRSCPPPTASGCTRAPAPQPQRAHALGPVDLVRRERQRIDRRRRATSTAQLADRLHGVDVQMAARGARALTARARARRPAGSCRARSSPASARTTAVSGRTAAANRSRADHPVGLGRHLGHLEAALREPPRRRRHRRVLERRRSRRDARAPPGPRRSTPSALASVPPEVKVISAGSAAERPRHLLARRLERARRLDAEPVRRRGVAIALGHRVERRLRPPADRPSWSRHCRGKLECSSMFGVYIHFPYCRKRCPYCDFAVHARARIPHDRYADAVVARARGAGAAVLRAARAHALLRRRHAGAVAAGLHGAGDRGGARAVRRSRTTRRSPSRRTPTSCRARSSTASRRGGESALDRGRVARAEAPRHPRAAARRRAKRCRRSRARARRALTISPSI